jgi:hypothetical protein
MFPDLARSFPDAGAVDAPVRGPEHKAHHRHRGAVILGRARPRHWR